MPRPRTTSLRLLVPWLLVVVLPATALADLDGPEVAFHTSTEGETLLWQQTSLLTPSPDEPGEVITIVPFGAAGPAAIHRYTGDSFGYIGDKEVGIFTGGFTIESVSAATSWGHNNLLVADPVSGVVWNLNTGGFNVELIPFAGVLPNSGDTDDLCLPIAVTSHAFSTTDRVAWYAEGSPSDHQPPWGPFWDTACSADAGGVLRRSNTAGLVASELDAGYGPGQVPIAATKGLAVDGSQDPPELLVVTGHGVVDDDWFTPRIVRKELSSASATDGGVANWYLPPDLAIEDQWNLVGEPAMVAAVQGDRVAIGGRNGLKLYDRDGSFLQDLWLKDRVEQVQTANFTDLLGLAADPEGQYLYALLGRDDNRLLVAWDTTTLEYMSDMVFCVGHELTDGGCEPGEDECAMRCDTIGDALVIAPAGATIRVEPGVYEETLAFHRRTLSLKTAVQGHTTVRGTGDGPVLSYFYSGLDPVEIDGFVFEGGTGLPWDYEDGTTRMGGGLLVVGGALVLRHSVLHHNQAGYGGGLGALLAPRIELQNVGLIRNHADDLGGGLAVAYPGMYDQTELVLTSTTVADNDAFFGPSVCLGDVDVSAFLTLLDAPEAPSLCTWAADQIGGELRYSALSPDVQWQMHDLIEDSEFQLPDGAIGDGCQLVSCGFEGAEHMDYHLVAGSPCADVTGEAQDPDGSDADIGMYGGTNEAWDWDWQEPVDDDDSGPDDDDAIDDDDTGSGDDDDGDDDDSAVVGLLPSGLRCDCSSAAAGAAPGLGLLLLSLLALRRRR